MALLTDLDQADIESVADQYGLLATSFQHIPWGVENTTYLIETPTGTHVLTILEKRRHGDAKLYADYLASLVPHGVPAPRLISSAAGANLIRVKRKPAVLTEHVEGVRPQQLSPARAFDLGRTLATLHMSGIECRLEPFYRIEPEMLEVAASFQDRRFGVWLVRLHEHVANAMSVDYPWGPTHGDPFPDNMLLSPEGRIVLLDWENAAHDLVLVDIAIAALGVSGDALFRPLGLRQLLAGYRSIAELEIEEDDLLDVILYVALFFGFHRYSKEQSGQPRAEGQRSYTSIRPLVESVQLQWDRVWS